MGIYTTTLRWRLHEARQNYRESRHYLGQSNRLHALLPDWMDKRFWMRELNRDRSELRKATKALHNHLRDNGFTAT